MYISINNIFCYSTEDFIRILPWANGKGWERDYYGSPSSQCLEMPLKLPMAYFYKGDQKEAIVSGIEKNVQVGREMLYTKA